MPAPRASRPLLLGTSMAAVLTLLALSCPTTPAIADTHQPTAAELRAAQQQVSSARQRVATLRERAGHAAEAYNGALVRAKRLKALSAAEASLSRAAEQAYQGTLAVATQAQAEATQATAQADLARAAQRAAQAEADAAQRAVDRIAIGAFRSDGQLGMLSQLFLARDPLELANGRNLMNRVGVYQDKVIKAASRARAAAAVATRAAQGAEEHASAAADKAAQALTRSTAARDKARASHRSAASAAAEAIQGSRDAERAKAYAIVLVGQAEAALGRAVRTKAQLEEAAAQARRDAAGLDDGTAPSDAARTAIHWAFEEIGVPYAWGGGNEDGPSEGFAQGAGTVGFDCSGLTLFIYAKAGIHLDHYSGSQWDQGQRISNRGDLLPGDLMFFAYDTSNPSTIHHVAIYIGKGKMIEAPYTGEVVRVASSGRSDFIGATRPWA